MGANYEWGRIMNGTASFISPSSVRGLKKKNQKKISIIPCTSRALLAELSIVKYVVLVELVVEKYFLWEGGGKD